MIPPLHVGEVVVPHSEAEVMALLTQRELATDKPKISRRALANMIVALLEERRKMWQTLQAEYGLDPVHAELAWPKALVERLAEMDADQP